MRRALSLLVVLELFMAALLGFAPASAHAADLASIAAPAPAGTDAILPPSGAPSWHWWWGGWPSPPWACTLIWPSTCPGLPWWGWWPWWGVVIR